LFVEVNGVSLGQNIRLKWVTAKILQRLGLREGLDGRRAAAVHLVLDADSPMLLLYGIDHNSYANSIPLWIKELAGFET
jgi:hypothetical protein